MYLHHDQNIHHSCLILSFKVVLRLKNSLGYVEVDSLGKTLLFTRGILRISGPASGSSFLLFLPNPGKEGNLKLELLLTAGVFLPIIFGA